MGDVQPTVIGKISYTNSWPVFHHFDPSKLRAPAVMVSAVPSALNRGMAEGSIHVGALSSFAYAEASERLLLLPGLSVSADGPVQSILLFTREPLERAAAGRIALTNTSATSVNLLKILLGKAYGASPEYVTAEPDLEEMMKGNDGALLIGDHAIRASWQDRGYRVYDLGQLWKDWTGLGMTFAVWAVNAEAAAARPEAVSEIAAAFAASKRAGLRQLGPIVQAAREQVGGGEHYWYGYFRRLCYDFAESQKEGLGLYFRLAHEMGLLERPVQMKLWNDNTLTRVKR